jgi:putative hydrolase of the HAD superfamily
VVALKTETSTVKAVTFDVWETLLFERDGASSQRTVVRCKNIVQTLNRFGLPFSVEDVGQALGETISSLVRTWDKNKDVSHLEQIRIFFEHLTEGKLVLKDEWIKELSVAYVSPVFEVPPYLNPDARELLRSLKSQNKLLGIVCNTGMTPGTELRRFLAMQGVGDCFDLMIFSDEVGVRKPDSRIFDMVARGLRVKPHEIVHVGDNLKSDAWGAKNAGLVAIHLSGSAGRDKMAESDPKSLVSLSRNLGNLKLERIAPDRAVASLAMVKEVIAELENTRQ